MTRFELQASGVRSDCSTNWATTITAQVLYFLQDQLTNVGPTNDVIYI